MLIKKNDFKFLQEFVSAGVKLKRVINFTEDLYIKGSMLKSQGKYFHPIIVLLMSQDVEFEESFLWNFVKDALSPEVPPEYLYYYLNTNTKYNEPSKYGSKSAMLVDLMKTKPENYLVKAKILIRYGADKTFCDEDGKYFNDYVTNEELEELILLFIINFL